MTTPPVAPPAYATQRNPDRPTFGDRVAHIAAHVMGTPLMPWQKYVADVALELDLERPGEWAYTTVIVSVPRQSGKTALMRAVAADRLLAYRDHVIQMTAQTGKDARKRWDQIIQALDVDHHPHAFKKYASKGAEALTYKRTGSTLSPFAPTPTAVHGDSLNLVMIDEAWAFDEESGTALTAAINPTFATVIDSQLWIVSTKGTARSAYLNRLITQGRAATKDPYSRTAYFEWSADPDLAAADPYGRDTLAFHPAIGHTQTFDKILTLGRDEPLATWKRSYLNLEDLTGETSIIDLAIWDSLATPSEQLAPPGPGLITVGVDVASDGSGATIYGAYRSGEDTQAVCLAAQSGTMWVTDAISRIYNAGYTDIVADGTGPMRTVLAELEEMGIPVTVVNTREYAAACQWLIDKTKAGTVHHDGDPATRAALEDAVTRPLAGTMAFSATKSPKPIDAIRALALAAHRASSRRNRLQLF